MVRDLHVKASSDVETDQDVTETTLAVCEYEEETTTDGGGAHARVWERGLVETAVRVGTGARSHAFTAAQEMTHAPAPKRRTVPPSDGSSTQQPPPPSPPATPPPDGGWGWVVVFASFMIHIVTDGVTYSFGVLYVEFLTTFKEGKGATALIGSILAGVTLCSGPISSSFVNKYGCRAVTIAGSILGCVSLALSVFAKSVFTLYFTIGLGAGFGFGLIYLPAIVSVTCYFEKYRSLATGIAVAGSGLGTFIFAPFTETLIRSMGWKGTILVIAGLVLSCSFFGALFRPLETEENVDGVVQVEEVMPMVELKRGGSMEKLAKAKDPERSRLAQSQPSLQLPDKQSHSMVQLSGSTGRLMQRKDILYSGSVHNLHLQHRSSSRIPDQVKVASNNHIPAVIETTEEPANTKVFGCIPCSPEAKETLDEMLDISLFKDLLFILFTVSNFLTSIGFYIPYTYIVAQAETLDVSLEHSSYLLSVVGVSNTIGRLVLGYVSDKSWVNRLYVYNTCLGICGVATALCVFCTGFYSLAVYCSVFGFTIGAYVGLTSVILVDLLGLDKLTNAFGLLLLFQGFASLLGPPIGGWLYDATGSYDPAFYVSGATIAVSGFMLFAIPVLQRKTLGGSGEQQV